MCIISVSLEGRKFTEEDLKKMWDANPHGAGIAWLEGSKVRVRKGFMKFDKFIEFYQEKIPPVMHAVHFRLRSAGEVSPQLTHPFRIDTIDMHELEYIAKAVLFHNGTVSDWRSLFVSVLAAFSKKEREKILSLRSISDTYVVSLLVNRYGHKVLKHLDVGGRWLIFRPKPVFYGVWDEDKKRGFKFSNMSWRYDRTVWCGYRSYLNGWKGGVDVL